MNNTMFQFYAENSNFFNYIFLGALILMIFLVSTYWYLSLRFYIKTKDNTIDPHLISELKAPSKIFYLLLITLLSSLFYVFLQFAFANYKENLSSFKYMFLKDENILISNSRNISHTMDTQIPLAKIETLFVNNFTYEKYNNLDREYCQISLKITQPSKHENENVDNNPKNKEIKKHKDLENTFTITIPKSNLVNKDTCLDVAKDLTYKLNDYKKSLNLPTVGLLKTIESKPIEYNKYRNQTLLIQYWMKLITKPGSFFMVE